MRNCGLRREVEKMMKILGRGPWHLAFTKISASKFRYQLIDYSQFARTIVIEGVGASKREALENLLETWRSGQSELECPAKSREELEVKLTLLGIAEKEEKEEKKREDDSGKRRRS